MIEQVFRKTRVRRRLQDGPLASVAREYLAHLVGRGYAECTVHQYVQATEHFGHWFATKNRAPAQADASSVEEFLGQHLPRCRCPPPRSRGGYTIRAALRQLLVVVRGVGVAVAKGPPLPRDALVNDFERHLIDTCGAAPATRYYYLRETRDFLADRFREGVVDVEAITHADVRGFVTRRAKAISPASANCVATAIRSFIRFLHLRGLASAVLTDAVPRAADWRLARIPRVLTDTEVEAFLGAFDRTRAHGRRNYAIAVCLLDLGLRAGDIGRIKLDDVDWRASALTLAPGKSRRGSCLPMPARVARALADYLRRGRPQTIDRTLFVHDRAPRGKGIGPTAVRSAVRLAYARAGLDPRLTGTHVLRHTAATRLLRAGVSMKEIADVLGHRSIDTSAIYTKVDLSALTAVALPWPEVRS